LEEYAAISKKIAESFQTKINGWDMTVNACDSVDLSNA